MRHSKSALILASLAALATPSIAHAELPASVKAMIDAALETGDDDKVRTVIEIAKATNPDDAAQIDAILAEYEAGLAEETAAKEDEIRKAGFFENWTG